MKWKNKRKLN